MEEYGHKEKKSLKFNNDILGHYGDYLPTIWEAKVFMHNMYGSRWNLFSNNSVRLISVHLDWKHQKEIVEL